MAATGPYFWTQTLKWMDPGGTARARWHRLDLASNPPFSNWDAGDGDGPQAWQFQEFNCPGFDSGLVASSVQIACAYSASALALARQAEALGWFLDLTHYQIITGGLVRVDSVLLGSVTVSGGLTGFSIGATSSPPPVAVSVPSLLLTQQNIGAPCGLDFP
jgi:hypothetical protein